jgi:hypothetical protein
MKMKNKDLEETEIYQPGKYKFKWYEKYLWNPIYRLWYKISLIPQKIKFFFQRKIRGFDDSIIWDLGYETLKWLSPRLELYIQKGIFNNKDNGLFYHEVYDYKTKKYLTEKEWKKILQEILWLTKHPGDPWDYYGLDCSKEEVKKFYKRQYKACELLGKYLLNLMD